ncbi:Short-chain dehydrogenase/reductase pkfC [Paramyrothecium foliicola]|nr:Short-chain dehydrogenase/reductase pkfC [Paramyrothecium foliicola]
MEGLRRSSFVPYNAPLTEQNLPDQSGKVRTDSVILITGASSGVGKELARILYQRNATVYMAARSQSRTEEAINDIKASHPNSKGQLKFLKLQLDDLATIKASANQFLAQESRLDVLVNNAGVMTPPQGSKTVQGHELQLGTNVLGHFLFVQFLTQLLVQTAKTAPKHSVRLIWVSSVSADFAPKPAINFSNMDYHEDESAAVKYNRSKAGNLIHAAEFARLYRDTGIVSLSLNPGLLNTGLQKNFGLGQRVFMILQTNKSEQKIMGRPAKFGAYTELFAGFDASITQGDLWITPFGRKEQPRPDLVEPELGRKYWEWSEAQVKAYL